MNPVQLGVEYIKREIPRMILDEAFMPRRYNPARTEYFRDNLPGTTVEAALELQIVKGWVGVDVNLCSGITDHINLAGASVQQIDPWNQIYTIPDSVTLGRTITSVYNVSYGEGGYASVHGSDQAMCGSSELLSAMGGLLDSHRTPPTVSTARVQIVGHNIIHISDSTTRSQRLWLYCQLTHDPDFTNITPAYSIGFAKLCALAAKAHVYRELPVLIEEGIIRNGATIGRIREYVDGYSDALTMYYEQLDEQWKKQSFMNDKAKHRTYLGLITGGWTT